MLPRRCTLCLMVLGSLLLAGFAVRARADYGVVTAQPLADPLKAEIDERPTGTWRATIQEKTYYLHVGSGGIVGQANWMELILVNQGEKHSFYLHHRVGYTCTIGDQNYFHVANMSKEISQLRGVKAEELISSVERYSIMKYDVTEDTLDVWSADQKLVREAIEAGEIKGSGENLDDTAENVRRFIESAGPKLWRKNVHYVRVK